MKKRRMKLAYIAGPYRAATVYGIKENIRRAEAVALKWWKKGYAVICPHANTSLFDGELPDETFLEGTMEMLRRSDVVVMMPGWEKSAGSIAEREEALMTGKHVEYQEDV